MFKLQLQVASDHPILFLHDACARGDLPEALGTGLVTATADCACFNVLSEVDGTTLVTLTDQNRETASEEMFGGTLHCPTGVLTVSDSSGFHHMSVRVPVGPVAVSFHADDAINPNWVWITVGATGTR